MTTPTTPSRSISRQLGDSPRTDDIPLVRIESEPTRRAPALEDAFPTPSSASMPVPPVSQILPESSSSLLTHSDKLSELPPSSPPLGRVRTPSRLKRTDAPSPLQQGSPSLGMGPLPTSTNESDGKDTPKHRVSFDSTSDRASLPSFQKVREAVARISRHTPSEPGLSSPGKDRGDSRSPGPSRGQSPLRMFWPLHRMHSREEPFVPVDPYRFLFSFSLSETLSNKRDTLKSGADQLSRQIYRHLLLRLPSIYFTRVCRIFQDAEVSRPEIQRMIDGAANGAEFPLDWTPPTVSPALSRFKESWEEFVDSVMREWKTLNVVSALLLSAILTMFQIQDAADDPVTRTAALLSLMSALWSLSFGCIYILRFGTMRSMYKASRWAEEAQESKTSMLWNVWVLLSMPAVWLAWSMIFFVVSILSFVWTTGSAGDQPTRPPAHVELGLRIAVTCSFALGLVYFAFIVRTFQAYGGGRPGRGRAGGPRWRARERSGGDGGGDGVIRMSGHEPPDLEKGERKLVEERGRKVSPRL